jgi:type I restriction enzyme, S subunit
MPNNIVQQNIPGGWKLKKLSDVLDYERPDAYIVKSTSYDDKAKTPVLTANKSFVLGYTDEDFGIYGNTPAIIFDDFTTDSKFVDFPFKVKSSAIKILKEKNKDIDLRFVFEKMKSVNFPTGSHKRFYISQYQNLEITLPPIKEQKKIAEILEIVDEDIAKTQEVIKATEKLKRGLMQQLFTRGIGHTKFKETTLKEALDSVIDHRGLTPKKLGGDWSENGIPAISAMNVKNGEIIKPETIRHVDDVLFKKWMPEGIESGDVLLTSEAPLGEAYLVKPNDKYCLSQRLFALRPRSKELIGTYLYYFLISPNGQKRLLERATGSTAKGIRQTELLKIDISYPDLNEQKGVTEILSAIDEKISVNKKLKGKFTLLKKGLMQDLLSGIVRVII